jgi:hypothetical protein
MPTARTKGAGVERKRIERGEGNPFFFFPFLFFSFFSFLSGYVCWWYWGIDHYGVFLTSEPSCKGELTWSFWAIH